MRKVDSFIWQDIHGCNMNKYVSLMEEGKKASPTVLISKKMGQSIARII